MSRAYVECSRQNMVFKGVVKIFQFRKVINYDITEKFMNAQLMN